MSVFHTFPFPFQTRRNKYLYDPGSNEIFRVDPLLFDAAKRVLESPEPGAAWANVSLPPLELAELRAAREQGFLRADVRPISVYPDEAHDECERLHEQLVPQVFVVEVTENCNLRCSYCCYSGEHAFQRGRTHAVISKSLLREAVDRLAACWRPGEHRCISFYGGEPLLELESVLCAMDYARTRWPDPSLLHFSVTTNGTLLTLSRAKALLARGTTISVSLDGDKVTHDWARLDAQGRGTFDVVLENLRQVFCHFGRDLQGRLRILSVFDTSTRGHDFVARAKLLAREPWLADLPWRISVLTKPEGQRTDYQSRPVENDDSLFRQFVRSHHSDVVNPQTGILGPSLRQIHKRPRSPLGAKAVAGGMCIPGRSRMFMTVDGSLFLCERVDSRFCIGSIGSGLDSEKVRHIMSRWADSVRTACCGCWAFRLCSKCPAAFCGVRDTTSAIAGACRSVQTMYGELLAIYCSLLEQDASFFAPNCRVDFVQTVGRES